MPNEAQIAHGPMLIGFMLNAILFGIMITQVYLYFTTYKKDRVSLKILVTFLLIADAVNTVFDFVYLYNVLILHWGDGRLLAEADWLFATDPVMTGVIATVVQLFFAWRIRVLTKNWLLVSIVTFLAISGLVGAVVTTFEVTRSPNFVDFRKFKAVVILWLASEALGDMLITIILVRYLRLNDRWAFLNPALQRKHKTGFKKSDLIVDRIIRVTVQTGLVTSLVAILDLIFFLADPTGTHLIFNFPLCKLYTNSLMSSLNSRKGWRISPNSSSVSPSTEGSFHVSSFPISAESNQEQSFTKDLPQVQDLLHFGPQNHPEIFVSMESHQLTDTAPRPVNVIAGGHYRHRRRETDGFSERNETSVTPKLHFPNDPYQGSQASSTHLREA